MVSSGLLEGAYVLFSVTLVLAGLSMVALAVRAYFETDRSVMLYLSVGFALIVAAAIATTFSAFVSDFQNSRLLLTTNYAITTVGYVFIIYSVLGRG